MRRREKSAWMCDGRKKDAYWIMLSDDLYFLMKDGKRFFFCGSRRVQRVTGICYLRIGWKRRSSPQTDQGQLGKKGHSEEWIEAARRECISYATEKTPIERPLYRVRDWMEWIRAVYKAGRMIQSNFLRRQAAFVRTYSKAMTSAQAMGESVDGGTADRLNENKVGANLRSIKLSPLEFMTVLEEPGRRI